MLAQHPQSSPRSSAPHCSLCHSPYDLYYHLPHVLPKCGHTHCQQCIASRVTSRGNRRIFSCPVCQAQVIVRKGVAEDIPKNISIIDIIKNSKRHHSSAEKQEGAYLSMMQICQQHKKPLELLCETCANFKICSHCVLFGTHKDHTFRKQHTASKVDLEEVKEVFQLISDSVRAVLMPGSKGNIREVITGRVREGLGKAVTGAFREYYEVLRRRETELMEECGKILIGEGGIDRNIDQLLHEYDSLSTVFSRDFKQGGVGIAEVEGYIGRCKDLHNSIEQVEEHAKFHVEKVVKSVETYLKQTTLFKITQVPFSLKEAVRRAKGGSGVSSPEKKQQQKCVSQDNKQSERGKTKQSMKKSTDNFAHSRGKKEAYSYIDKSEVASQDSQIDAQPGRSQLNRGRSTIRQQSTNMPPKATRFKPSQTQNLEKSMNFKNSKESHSSKKPFATAQSPNKTVSAITPSVPFSPSQLKFAPPSKEVPFQLVSKQHSLVAQIDRQGQASCLQLVGAQITDTIMPYLLDHIRKKQYRFQIIKMVKNNITDQGMRILLSYLSNDRTTQVLNLTTNQLTQRSIDWILHFAELNSTLRTIYISNNKISPFQLKMRKEDIAKYELELIV